MLTHDTPKRVISKIPSLLLLFATLTALITPAASGAATSAKNLKTLAEVTSVTGSVFKAVGSGSSSTPVSPPSAVSGQALLKIGAKPEILYVGAEFCPYCAAERWPLIIALSRFGTFRGLGLIDSAPSPEVYPNTPTLSFYGSTYTSKYIAFVSVETETRTHSPLMTMTGPESNLVQKYDNSTFLPGLPYPDSIPFVDFGDQYLQVGSSYTPTILDGSTQSGIAARLSDSSNSVTQTIITSANEFVADICSLTKQLPTNVCR